MRLGTTLAAAAFVLGLATVGSRQLVAQDITPPAAKDTSKAAKVLPDTGVQGFKPMVAPKDCPQANVSASVREPVDSAAAKLPPAKIAAADSLPPQANPCLPVKAQADQIKADKVQVADSVTVKPVNPDSVKAVPAVPAQPADPVR